MDIDKTKEELINELQLLLHENNSLKNQKEKSAAELIIANIELQFQNDEKEKRAAELIIADLELKFQSKVKAKRAAELVIANIELVFQNKEKEKRAAELIIANKELVFQNELKEKRAAELIIANKELLFQNQEKEKRAAELIIANKELARQNREKEKRAAELIIANKELLFQNEEKEKRAAELSLAKDIAEEFENKFREITENVDEVFWLRSDSEMIYVSPTFEKIWGIPVQKIYKNAEIFTEKIHPDDQPIVKEIIQSKEFKNKGMFSYEYRIIQPDNNIRWINSRTFPILDDSGKIIKRAGIAHDVTERYHNIQALVKAMEKAEKSDRLKSAFLANMSHEIRTPMNGILGFAELLKEPDLNGDKQQEYIEIIENSGLRMLNIINNIVDISKIESGLMEINRKESNINEQMEYVQTFFKPEIESKKLQLLLKKKLPMEDAIINTDREKIYAILTNLVKNAIKNTNKGLIEFGCDKKGDILEFFVKDTGIGIPKNRQEAVFERFIQADISDVRAMQGAGLGLAISKAYVELLGGRMWLESEVGKGSTFYFAIPYGIESEDKSVNVEVVTEDETKNIIQNLKILIAEDDKPSETLMSIQVRKFSKEILKAKNGFDAVEICRNNPDTDLILMDIQMPVMNGYEATRQIREFNNEVVIIAQTAFAQSGDREKSIAAGCNDYISKPINKAELLTLIHRYFNK